MGLLPRPMIIFPLIMFLCCCFCLSRATDCGGSYVANTIIVDQQGKGSAFKTIQLAINSIKRNNDRWFKIHINPGIYEEKIYIPIDKPCVILEGSGSNTTIITSGYHEISKKWEATFSSVPPNVVVSGITFENSYNLGGSIYIKPAVAAAFFGDKSAIFNCSFLSYQDTLFAAEGRHYFKDCYIQGEVDFIFGSGQSYFENCTMNATLKKYEFPGFVTAQRRESPNDPNGFVFRGGFVVGNGEVKLGRPWGPYSRVIFWETDFSSVVTPQGWDAWDYTTVPQVMQITYAEVNCTGPGAYNKMRVWWVKTDLDNSELNGYSLSSFLNTDKWLDNIPPISL